jgi:hypothetical protein
MLKNKIIYYLFILFCGVNYLFSQNNGSIVSFSINYTDNQVVLNWALDSGTICNGISIARSVNGTNFENIGEIVGVCGSSYSREYYSFIDSNPVKNKINYYRVTLGFSDISETVSIEIIDIEQNNYQLRPNPVKDFTRLYFSNNTEQAHNIIITDLNGKVLIELNTISDNVLIDTSILPDGVYNFAVINNKNKNTVSGKFIVAK